MAGPPSTWYRARKLVRRHRVEATAAALITGALVAGLAVSVRFWLQAKERAEEAETAREAVDTMLVRVADDRLEHVPQAESVRRELLADALAFYRELEAREPADASLRREVVHARSATASILRSLGRVPEALEASERALAQIEAMLATEPDNARLLRLRASARATQALVRLNRGEVQQSYDLHHGSVSDLEPADVLDPAGADGKRMSAALNNLGMSLAQARPAAAREALAKGLALYEASRAPGDDGLELARLRANYGSVLADAGDPDAAVRELRAAIAVLAAAADPMPQRNALARAHLALGDTLRARGEAAAAVPEYGSAERIQREMVRDFPATPGVREALAGILANKAVALEEAGDQDGALAANQASLDIRRQLVAAHPDHVGYRTTLVRTLANRVSAILGRAGAETDLLSSAEALADEAAVAVVPLAKQAGEDPDTEFLAAAVASLRATIALLPGGQQRCRGGVRARARDHGAARAAGRGVDRTAPAPRLRQREGSDRPARRRRCFGARRARACPPAHRGRTDPPPRRRTPAHPPAQRADPAGEGGPRSG